MGPFAATSSRAISLPCCGDSSTVQSSGTREMARSRPPSWRTRSAKSIFSEPARQLLHADRRILRPHVREVFLVFEAVVIDQFAVENQRLIDLNGPWCFVRLRIVDRDLDFERAVIRAADSFRNLALPGQRIARCVQPKIVSETGSLDHHR